MVQSLLRLDSRLRGKDLVLSNDFVMPDCCDAIDPFDEKDRRYTCRMHPADHCPRTPLTPAITLATSSSLILL